MSLTRTLAAEVIGTFALVFAGCGAIMVEAKTQALGQVGIAATFGLVIMAMVYALGHVSGAHFNPAVTFAFALTRHFPWPRVGAYWAAQLAGALVAALLLRASLGDLAEVGATLPSGSQGQAFVWELVLSFFLMLVIMAVATDTRAVGEAAAIAIGGTVALDALFGGPISGASMNPARSLGPALVGGNLAALWLYLLAPLLGAAIGAFGYQLVRGEQLEPEEPATLGEELYATRATEERERSPEHERARRVAHSRGKSPGRVDNVSSSARVLTFVNSYGSTGTVLTRSAVSTCLSARSPRSRLTASTGSALMWKAPGRGPVCGTAASRHAAARARRLRSVTSGQSTGRHTQTSVRATRSAATSPASGARTSAPSSCTGKGNLSPSFVLPTASRSSKADPSRCHARSASVSPRKRARAFGEPNRLLAPPTRRTPVTAVPPRSSHDTSRSGP